MYMEEFIEKFNAIFSTLKTKKSIAIWGIGRHTELLFQHTILSQLSITHIIDKNQFGSKFMNFIVENPEEINWNNTNFDTVIIVSLKYQEEIYQTLKETFNYSGDIIILYDKSDTDIFYLAQSKYMPLPSKLELQHSELKNILSRLKYDMRYSQVDSFQTRFQQNYSQYHKIKVYQLFTERIGEVIPRFFNIINDTKEDKKTYYLVLPDNNNFDFCNSSLLELMGRRIEIINQNNFLFWNYVFDNYTDVIDISELDLYKDRKFEIYFNKQENSYVEFTEKEKNYAKIKINEIGIKKEYVCMHIRDAEYLNNLSKKINRNVDWQYHDYRDVNIHNYEATISYLNEREITTVRMGKFTTTPFSYPGCIDYAFLHQEDLLDLYLIANCKFYIGTTSGILAVAQLFGKISVIVNAIPIMFGAEGSSFLEEDVIIFKKMWSKAENRFLNLIEMFDMDLKCAYRTENYLKHNIEIVENTPEEILDVIVEVNEKLDGIWKEDKETKRLQEKYIFIRNKWIEQNKINKAGIFPCQIGSEFLRKNRFLLDIK